jgi:hypothetical protein
MMESDAAIGGAANGVLRDWRTRLPLIRPAAITLRGLAEVDPKDRTRVLGVYPWIRVQRYGDGFGATNDDGTRVKRDGRPLALRVPNRSWYRWIATKMSGRAFRRAMRDGSLDLLQVYPPTPRRFRLASVLVLAFLAVGLGVLSFRVVTEIWPWFGQFTLGLRILTLVAVGLFMLVVVPVALAELVRLQFGPRNPVRRARWMSAGIEAELADGTRAEERWADLVRVRPRSDAFYCDFADGRSLALPRTIHLAQLLRIVAHRWPAPMHAVEARRRSIWLWVIAFLAFQSFGAVIAAGALETGSRQDGLSPLGVYLLYAWGLPIFLFLGLSFCFRVLLPWQFRVEKRASKRRPRPRLRRMSPGFAKPHPRRAKWGLPGTLPPPAR